MDKAAIFTEVTRRNALRKANGLPLLDVPREFGHQVAISAQRDFRVAYELHGEEHADDHEAIRQQVHSEYRAQNGAGRAEWMAGRWIISRLAQQRFEAYVAENTPCHGPIEPRSSTQSPMVNVPATRTDARL